MTAAALDAAAVAQMLSRAASRNDPDAWREVAEALAAAWPAPKRPKGKSRKASGDYARVLVTFADGHRELVGTYRRTAAGDVDPADAERVAVYFRKAIEWAKLETRAYRWARIGGRSALIPPECLVAPVSKVEEVSAADADELRPTLPREPWAPKVWRQKIRRAPVPAGGAQVVTMRSPQS